MHVQHTETATDYFGLVAWVCLAVAWWTVLHVRRHP